MIMNKIEIMAPAGSFESLRAAIDGGADSVYFGIGRLNMRSRSSQNFTLEDLHEIAAICSEAGVKSYVTLNTIVFDNELDEMKAIADACLSAGVSAVIASDSAVLGYLRAINQPLHISTQCNITNIDSVRFYSQFADVMVLARELSLKQVKAITRRIAEEGIKGPSGELVRIELFAHGALCMAVSGKCYLSLDNLNSSANRGACLQVCRRPYKVTDADGEIELAIDNEYIMSPKDLCTLPFLNRLIDAGVSVLKIEGRGRSAEYVKTVARVYKEAAESIVSGTFTDDRIGLWMKRLEQVYNRGFWGGYYLGQKLGEWSPGYGSQATRRKLYVGKVTNYFGNLGVAEIKVETNAILPGDTLIFNGPTTGSFELEVKEVRLAFDPVPEAQKGDTCSVAVNSIVRRSDKVYKWMDADS
ncbi:MAG TPA: collagenase-like protease [Bacteroidales bacterium]|nr:collagenase-like protease [Bacteroidales bacterium]HBZ65979.1 collagenase-like protease [Bacteroidales bacterium]